MAIITRIMNIDGESGQNFMENIYTYINIYIKLYNIDGL